MKPLVALLVVTRVAAADPLDEAGLGGAAGGMANARSAIATGGEAAHANPAGVALASGPELVLGYQYALHHLELDGHAAGVLDAHGTAIALAIPHELAGVTVAGGVALYLPDQFLASIETRPIAEAHFVRFETQSQRLVVEPVAAVAFGDFAVGAGASILADARGKQVQFDVGVVGGDKQGAAKLDVALPVRVTPLVGVRWKPSRLFEVAAVFRGELSLDVALDIRANVNVPGVVTGDAIVSLRSVSYFTPMRATLGAAVHPAEDLALTADATWERWSALGSGVPDLRVLLALDIMPPVVASSQPPARFHDIVTPRLGAEWHSSPWRFRAGAAYLPSPVPTQTGITSFADGWRTLVTLGAGYRLPPGAVLTEPIDFDLALGWQHVEHQLVTKDPALQPGGAFSSGGDIVQASASTTVRF